MKVCILGTAPGSRLTAPFEDQSYEIWVCSAGNSQAAAVPRVTKWFELHALCDMIGAENKAWSIPYFNWLRAQSFPIYMQEKNDLIPQAIVFPYKTLTERFGPNPSKKLTNWFTSSPAWMIGFALIQMKAGDELAIFGVDMAATEEHYSSQKAGCLRFMEIAAQMDIKVTVPYESCLAKGFPLYGYAEATNMGRKWRVRENEMAVQRQHIDQQIQQLVRQRDFFDGALESVRYDIRTWADGMDAELDTDGKEGLAMANVIKQAASNIGEERHLTGDYEMGSGGVFVPKGLGADAPRGSSEAIPPSSRQMLGEDLLPEGSTFTVDAKGKKHYRMRAEPAHFGANGMGTSNE